MKKIAIIAFTILNSLYVVCKQKSDYNTPVVAKCGDYKITLKEFRLAYLEYLKQLHAVDSKEIREKFLDEMIQRRLLASDAEHIGITSSEIFQLKVDAYHNKVLRDKHFEKIIKPKLNISEDEIEKAYIFTQESRRIKHLFFERKTQADSAYNALLKGASFDSIAFACFKDTALANSGGDLGWVEWDNLDYELGMTAFLMPIGQASAPVRSPYGYHIIKVMDYKKKPLITRQEYLQKRQVTKKLLELKLGDKYAFEYIANIMASAKIELKTEVTSFVANKLKQLLVRKPSSANQFLTFQLTESEFKSIETSLWDARNEVMAIINGKNFTVRDFIGALNFIPYQYTYSNFKKAFKCAVRDFIITQEAKKIGLDNDEDVIIKTRIYRDYILQLAFKRTLVRSVIVEDSDIKNYYMKHIDEFNNVPYEEIVGLADLVRIEKIQETVFGYIERRKKSIKIEKNVKPIHDYYEAVHRRGIE